MARLLASPRLVFAILLGMSSSVSVPSPWPGESLACSRGEAGLDSAIGGQLSAFREANKRCLAFCNPLLGTPCNSDCSQGLDAFQAACHSEAAHVYRLTFLVVFSDGVQQSVMGYVCLAGACGGSDVSHYATSLEDSRCAPLVNMSHVSSCCVTAQLDDIMSDSEAAVVTAGAVIAALAVVAILVVALFAWRWHMRKLKAAHLDALSPEGRTEGATSETLTRHNTTTRVSLDLSSNRLRPAGSMTEGVGAAQQPKGSTRDDVFKARYGATSNRPASSSAHGISPAAAGLTSATAPLLCDDSNSSQPSACPDNRRSRSLPRSGDPPIFIDASSSVELQGVMAAEPGAFSLNAPAVSQAPPIKSSVTRYGIRRT